MPAVLIDIKDFTIIPGTGLGIFVHKIQKGILAGDTRIFYQKEMESNRVACMEVLAQEFFRLIIPVQPETRIAYNPSLNTYFILSEEISGYKPLPPNSPSKFTDGEFPGLGQVMLTSVFLQEIDLKNGNICLNKENQVIKIDGDWCFAGIRSPAFKDYNKSITPELLASLPFPYYGYSAFNWLDISHKGIARITSRMVDEDLASAPHVRREINEAMLKILLLPDDYLVSFVDAYIPHSSKADIFVNYLKERREELKLAALQDESFNLYLKSSLAIDTVEQHLCYMKEFVVNGTRSIITESKHNKLDNEVLLNFEKLRAEATLDIDHSTAFDHLNAINLNLNLINSRQALLVYRDLLLKQIDNCIESLTNSADNKHFDQHQKTVRQEEQKKKRIKNQAAAVEKRFNELEQMGFDAHIDIFIKKQQEMVIKSLVQTEYIEASNKALTFYKALQATKSIFLSSDKSLAQARVDLKNGCLLAVKEARDVLDKHREWKGKIKKFLLDVLSFLTIGLSRQLGLFGKSDSGVKLDNFDQVLSKAIK